MHCSPPPNHEHWMPTDHRALCFFFFPQNLHLSPFAAERRLCHLVPSHFTSARKEEQRKHTGRIVYRAICAARHKVCLHSVAACRRCHTSAGDDAHGGDKAQFVISVTSAAKEEEKESVPAPPPRAPSASSALPAGQLPWGVASLQGRCKLRRGQTRRSIKRRRASTSQIQQENRESQPPAKIRSAKNILSH